MNPIGRLLNSQKLKIISVRHLYSVAVLNPQQQSSTPKISNSKSCYQSLGTTGLSCTLPNHTCKGNPQTKRAYHSISSNYHSSNFLNSPFFRYYVTINSAHGNHNIFKEEDVPYYAVPNNGFMSYEDERKNFHIHVPEFYNFCTDIIDKWAAIEKRSSEMEKLAFWWKDDNENEIKWTFNDLHQKSNQVANMLSNGCKLQRGDRVIVILPRVPEWWLVNLAAIRAGLVLSPGTTQLRAADIQHRLKMSGAKCIIADNSTRDLIDQVADGCPDLQHKIYVGPKSDTGLSWLNFSELMRHEPETFQNAKTRSSDTMMWFFTSGTTGKPKMTEHTHASYGLGSSIIARYFLTACRSDVIWNMSDTGWAKCAWSSLFAPWLAGACIFVHHTSSIKFQVESVLQNLEKFDISVLCVPATGLRLMLQNDLTSRKFKALRHCVSAGEPVNPDVIAKWKKDTQLNLYEGYGQTETTLLCGNYPFIEQKVGSMGRPPPGVDLQIVDNEGNVLPADAEGNLAVRYRPHRPVGLFSKYVGAPQATASVFCGDFYLTGDKAMMDKDGYFWFVGRSDDVIISSGYRIGPFEVESALIEHAAVLEAAVVSSPDPVRGEIVKAFVKLVPGYENKDFTSMIKELQEHTKMITAPYKYPRKIEFVDELPKTVSGKIRRVELRNKEWQKVEDEN